ncbi:MAG: tetratricopeptide repeat protein [Candidatus Omnitrophota bacterium]
MRRVIAACLCMGTAALILMTNDCMALDKRLSSSLSHYIMATMYDSLQKEDRAITEYKKALDQDKKNTLIHLGLASAYLKANEIDKAVDELNLVVKLDPAGVEAHAILSLVYFLQNNNDLANKEYELALKNASILDPQSLEIYKGLGLLYIRQKKFDSAAATYKKVLELSKEDAEAHFYLGSIYFELGDKAKAEQELEKALSLKADYAQALNFLGYFLAGENKSLDRAEVLVKKAIEMDPNNGAYIDSLGWVYFKQGKAEEALKLLLKSAALIDDPEIFGHLGDVYFKLGDKAKARTSWEKSLKANPGQKEIEKKIEAVK